MLSFYTPSLVTICQHKLKLLSRNQFVLLVTVTLTQMTSNTTQTKLLFHISLLHTVSGQY